MYISICPPFPLPLSPCLSLSLRVSVCLSVSRSPSSYEEGDPPAHCQHQCCIDAVRCLWAGPSRRIGSEPRAWKSGLNRGGARAPRIIGQHSLPLSEQCPTRVSFRCPSFHACTSMPALEVTSRPPGGLQLRACSDTCPYMQLSPGRDLSSRSYKSCHE